MAVPHLYENRCIYPKRSIEPNSPHVFRANLNSDQVHRVYLEDLDEAVDSLGVGLMQLIVADSAKTVTQAQALLSRVQPQEQTNPRCDSFLHERLKANKVGLLRDNPFGLSWPGSKTVDFGLHFHDKLNYSGFQVQKLKKGLEVPVYICIFSWSI